MTNSEIAAVLHEIAGILSILDDKPFRAAAYSNGARQLSGMTASATDLAREGKLGTVKGIGKALQEKITELVNTGELPYLDKLRSEVPEGVLAIGALPGIGPKKVRMLWKDLGITDLPELEEACLGGRLDGVKGFGPKVIKGITEAVARARRQVGQHLMGMAWKAADILLAELRDTFHVKHASIAGDARRATETVKTLEIVAAVDRLEGRWIEGSHEEDGVTVYTGRAFEDIPFRIYAVPEASYGLALHRYTGSEAHRAAVEAKLHEKGVQIGELRAETEEELYAQAGIAWVPPELREGDSLEVPADLLEPGDLKGALHVHSTWSDGLHELEDMIRQAVAEGFEYVGITDHSKTAAYAGGLPETRLRQQREAIEGFRKKYPRIRILHGSECDILPDGSMDYPDEVLRWLDFVVASIHSSFKMERSRMTDRICRALRNPFVDLIGHPTGRLILQRPGYEVDLEKVLECAAEEGKAMEINAHPKRLDLDAEWSRRAEEQGVPLSINPDAHAVTGLSDVRFGIMTARRAGLSRGTILNARPAEAVVERFARRR